jgi:redox-sensitive bicupin YhaK (pirin superfamily)
MLLMNILALFVYRLSAMRVIRSEWVSEGAGAKVLRILGNG